MCIRDRCIPVRIWHAIAALTNLEFMQVTIRPAHRVLDYIVQLVAVSYTHLRAHETVLDLVCRLLLEKKKHDKTATHINVKHHIRMTNQCSASCNCLI